MSRWAIASVLVCSGSHGKVPQTGGLDNTILFSHTSGGWAVQEEGGGQFGFSSWIVDTHLLAVSSPSLSSVYASLVSLPLLVRTLALSN